MNEQAGGEEQSLLCHSEHSALFQHEMHTHFCGLLIKKSAVNYLNPQEVTIRKGAGQNEPFL